MTDQTHWGAPGSKPFPRAVPAAEPVPSDAELVEISEKLSNLGLSLAPVPPEKREPTDKEFVANNINRLRHLDLKATVEEMFGETMPKDKFEAMDKMAVWSAANVYPKVSP